MKTKMTKQELKAYSQFVETHALARQKEQGEKYREADFVAGAMCVFFFLKQSDRIPAFWIFNPMNGKPIFNQRRES